MEAKNKTLKSKYLKLISAGEKIMVEASDGQTTIARSGNIFKSHIDFDFKARGLDKGGLATDETLFDVYGTISDATLRQMFTSLDHDLDRLVMTQSQVVRFCEKHFIWLCQGGHCTFFLIKENARYFVVRVNIGPRGLAVWVHPLRSGRIWLGQFPVRLVAPQLLSLAA